MPEFCFSVSQGHNDMFIFNDSSIIIYQKELTISFLRITLFIVHVVHVVYVV